jgi:hypothetical protein
VRRRAAAALGVGALSLACAWRLTGPGTPPLYDGPQVVAPYLYYCVPQNYHQSRAVQPKTQTSTLANIAQGIFLGTDEPPVSQVQVLIGPDTLVLPSGASDVTVTITPIAPPASLPSDGTVNGNVYTVAVTSGGQPVGIAKDSSGAPKNWTLVLRGEPGKPTSVIEQLDGGAWHRGAAEQPVGQADIYAANFASFGTFALVIPGAPGSPAPCRLFSDVSGSGSSASSGGADGGGGGGGTVVPIVLVVGGLLAVGAAIIAVRLRRPASNRPPTRRH